MKMTLELMESLLNANNTDVTDKVYFRFHLLEILSEASKPMTATEIAEIMEERHPARFLWEHNSPAKVAMNMREFPEGMVITTIEEVTYTFPHPYNEDMTIIKKAERKLYQIGNV